MSREYTRDEVQEMFQEHVRHLVDYWRTTELQHLQPGQDEMTYRMEGLAFSIMVLLDGGTMLPAFMVIPMPHESDKDYSIKNDEDYFPPVPASLPELCDIAGGLHETLFKKKQDA